MISKFTITVLRTLFVLHFAYQYCYTAEAAEYYHATATAARPAAEPRQLTMEDLQNALHALTHVPTVHHSMPDHQIVEQLFSSAPVNADAQWYARLDAVAAQRRQTEAEAEAQQAADRAIASLDTTDHLAAPAKNAVKLRELPADVIAKLNIADIPKSTLLLMEGNERSKKFWDSLTPEQHGKAIAIIDKDESTEVEAQQEADRAIASLDTTNRLSAPAKNADVLNKLDTNHIEKLNIADIPESTLQFMAGNEKYQYFWGSLTPDQVQQARVILSKNMPQTIPASAAVVDAESEPRWW